MARLLWRCRPRRPLVAAVPVLVLGLLLGTLPAATAAVGEDAGLPTVGRGNLIGKTEVAPPRSRVEQMQAAVNDVFDVVATSVESVLFAGIPTGTDRSIPLILLILVLGGVFFTFRYGLVNFRLFRHAIQILRGKFDHPGDEGEISHFQAVTSALSATIGLGNIAGVAVAIAMGGPGAVFWMWVVAFFGMSSKFSCCALAQVFRRINPDGTVLGGPMIYLEDGIRRQYPRLAWLGKVFGVSFAVFTIFGALGGGNMFQGNQSYRVLAEQFQVGDHWRWFFGAVMAFLVGLVIIGGIRRIGEVTSRLVPAMCVFYCSCCLAIIALNYREVPEMFLEIFTAAFHGEAIFGGTIGVMITGARRAAFSNEAGLGSAAIAHAAARTREPVREGIVAMLEPFIDTIVVCTMTALALLITHKNLDPATGMPYTEQMAAKMDIQITVDAFRTLGAWAPLLLMAAVWVFAYSTMISWSYYGERATEYLVGRRGILPYRILFVAVVVLGPILTLDKVIAFSDTMMFSMAVPNIIGMVMLSGLLHRQLRDYTRRLRAGELLPER